MTPQSSRLTCDIYNGFEEIYVPKQPFDMVTMKIVVLLCGTSEAGETRTSKAFFKVSHVKRLKPMQLLTRIIAGKKVYVVSLSSPKNNTL
jgi:hypothetical protein